MSGPKQGGPASCRTLGERINYVRTQRKVSWNEIDRISGLARGHARMLFVRQSKGRADTVRKLASALGVSLGWLADGQGPAPTKRELTATKPEAAS